MIPVAAVVAGLAVLLAGAWLVYPPAALVLGGVALLAAGLFVDWDGGKQ